VTAFGLALAEVDGCRSAQLDRALNAAGLTWSDNGR
jgi:hypothetical protein